MLSKTCFDRTTTIPSNIDNQATRLWLCHCQSLQIRVFHITWFSFWLCFFGWFATANLYSYIEADLGLTDVDRAVAGGCSVASTVIFRVVIGVLCDRIGPRYAYTILMVVSAFPICFMALVEDNVGYIINSFFIGVVGAGFVITQYHTTVMFAGKTVGAANATSAGWGNFGGGCANAFMPLFLQAIQKTNENVSDRMAWRYTMLIPGISLVMFCAPLYFFCTKDTPNGNLAELATNEAYQKRQQKKLKMQEMREQGLELELQHQQQEQAHAQAQEQAPYVANQNQSAQNGNTKQSQANVPNAGADSDLAANINSSHQKTDVVIAAAADKGRGQGKDGDGADAGGKGGPFMLAVKDYRTWILFAVYAGCFGMELTVLRFASGFLQYDFGMSVTASGFMVLLFSVMNLFARSVGGVIADFVSRFTEGGIQSRVTTLFIIMLCESIFMALFSVSKTVDSLPYCIVFLVLFSLFVQAAEGVTFAVVPFIQPTAIGPVAGIVGAGGNLGAMIYAFAIFSQVPDRVSYTTAWNILSGLVFVFSFPVLFIRFSNTEVSAAKDVAGSYFSLSKVDVPAQHEPHEAQDINVVKSTNANANANE